MTVTDVSRHLPTRHAKWLAELENGPLELDGRSQSWVDELRELEFIKVKVQKTKSKTSISIQLTDRGRYALERDRRGVDPYLVLT